MVKKVSLSQERFEDLVKKALETLPEEFQSFLENVAIIIEDEPPDDMPDVMGLYEGIPLVERSCDSIYLPDRIIIFKGPIERACQTYAEIEAEIRHTLLHEIGHFFGLKEEQLRKNSNRYWK